LNPPPSSFSFIPEVVSRGIIFPFTYICTQYTHPFSHLLPTLTGTAPSSLARTCSDLLFSDFVKEKKWHFCLVKVAIRGVSLWHFHVYMYYNLNWLYFSSFYLTPLLMVISTSLKILYSGRFIF
jgi:hypothetical protein